jgi:3-oxoacyl-[acyl-carrier-protein] synthase II
MPTVVTGLGMVTPAGVGTAASWAGITAGRPTATHRPELKNALVDIACRVPDFDPVALLGEGLTHRSDRSAQFALAAAREAMAAAGLEPRRWADDHRVGCVLGISSWGTATEAEQRARFEESGPNAVSPYTMAALLPSAPTAPIGIEFGVRGPSWVVTTACASGTDALGQAAQLIDSGQCDVVLAGGCEASITPFIVTAYARMKVLSQRTDEPAAASRPFDADRDGFVCAEGAAVLVLESAEHARARGAEPLAVVAGYGATSDAHHVAAPEPTAASATEAIRRALAAAGLPGERIDHVNAHGTSTRRNDPTEARAIRAAIGERPTVTSVKGALGHPLGAAGAIEAACTVLSLRDQLVPPTANLDRIDPEIGLDVVAGPARPQAIEAAASLSFGFGGHNAALVLTRP